MKIIYTAAFLLLNSWAIAQEPLIVAHRGASKEAPENTMAAFQLAWKQGADAIEGDFHLSKDGRVVCIHDGNTKKIAGTNLVVKQSSLVELQKVAPIPTIAEVFSTIPDGKKIYIEIKCGVEIIPALLGEIKASGLKQEQVVVISFKGQVIEQMKAKAPQFKAYWLCSFKKHKDGQIVPSQEKVLTTLKQIGADGLSSNTGVSLPVIEAVQKNGHEWHVWTVNDLATADKMRSLGAQSVTTDVPGSMKEHFAPKPTAGDRGSQ